MNTCILIAKILDNPQLRYTQDSQLPVAQMLVEFAGLGPSDPPSRLKAVGWGNLATEIQETYHEGEQVIIQGRLRMDTIDRQEGFKEKRAELTISHIYKVGELSQTVATASSVTQNNINNNNNASAPEVANSYTEIEAEETERGNLDEIPF